MTSKKPMRDDYWIFMGPSGMPRAVEKCTFMPTINPQRIEGAEWINFKQVDPTYDAMVASFIKAAQTITSCCISCTTCAACELKESLALYREWVGK